MPYAVGARGVRIHYQVAGEGKENVVLIQGLGLSSRFWFEQPELLLQDRSHAYRVLVLDNRGTGKSDKPRPPYRMAEMADDVIAAMDAAGMRRAVVVGISMGGMIAQHVALRHPNRVDGLVLLATTPGLPHGRLPGARALGTLLSMPVLVRRGGLGALASILLTKEHAPNANELMHDWPAALRAERVPPLAFVGQVAAIALHSTGFRLGKLDIPVVVVGAEQDVLVPAAMQLRKLAALIPHAELEMLTSGRSPRDPDHRPRRRPARARSAPPPRGRLGKARGYARGKARDPGRSRDHRAHARPRLRRRPRHRLLRPRGREARPRDRDDLRRLLRPPHPSVRRDVDDGGRLRGRPLDPSRPLEHARRDRDAASARRRRRVDALLRDARLDEPPAGHHPKAPHYYLFALGVDPAHQGRGLGSTLLRAVTSQCDAKNAPAYLEASTEKNARLYQRHGFRVTEEFGWRRTCPPWLMWREPNADRAGQ